MTTPVSVLSGGALPLAALELGLAYPPTAGEICLPHGSPLLRWLLGSGGASPRGGTGLFPRCLRLQMTAPAMSSNASAPRAIEMTAEWRANMATTITTTGVMIRKARDVC